MGLTTLSALVIANMVGAGIFTSTGFSMAALGNPGRVMFAWVVCGLWAVCGAIAYGGLVSRLPQSGGEYLFLSRFVHPAVGFIAGWISVIAGFTAPISVAALTAAVYLLPGQEEGALPLKLAAAALIVVATICNVIGLTLGKAAQNLIVGLKLILLAITILWAFFFTSSELWVGTALTDRDPSWCPSGFGEWSTFVASMSWIALSYTGFNAAIYVAGESKNSRTLVPRSMLLATLFVTGIYWLLNIVYVYAPPPESISLQPDVAAIATEHIGGTSLSNLIRLVIILSMSSSVFAMLLAGPRVYQKMAEDGAMPQILKGKVGSPVQAIVFQAILSIIPLFLANLLELMQYLGLTLSACGALAVTSLWWVRAKLPEAKPLRAYEIVALVIYLGITLLILAAAWKEQHTKFLWMAGTFALGLVVYGVALILKSDQPAPPASS
ncbi:MAG: APC family permease [Planctomycetota bacterium]